MPGLRDGEAVVLKTPEVALMLLVVSDETLVPLCARELPIRPTSVSPEPDEAELLRGVARVLSVPVADSAEIDWGAAVSSETTEAEVAEALSTEEEEDDSRPVEDCVEEIH